MQEKENQPGGEILLYQTQDGRTRVECRFEDDTIWLSQAVMAELFDVSVPTINEHLKNIFASGEQDENSVIRKFLITAADGKNYQTRHYNLDMILAVGFRVRSNRGTAFRQWATARLNEYLRKGFVMDDERLKNPPGPGVPDYFDELLERIRDIRASEKRMYLKVRDIFALAADYKPDANETREFFQVMQNKLHFAATGMTAAELIHRRADHAAPNMGLTAWKGEKPRRTDVTVAKNYLQENEISELNRIVVMYLDYAEDQARRRNVLYMRDWREKLDAFLEFNDREILDNPGKVSKAVADTLAQEEYEKFHARRLKLEAKESEQAFEEAIKQLPKNEPQKKAAAKKKTTTSKRS